MTRLHITVVINAIADLTVRTTTALLAHAAAKRGHDVGFAAVEQVVWDRSHVRVDRTVIDGTVDLGQALEQLVGRAPQPHVLGAGDVVLIRTNPGRAPDSTAIHGASLGMLAMVAAQGVRVLNSPAALLRMESKLSTLELPADLAIPSVVSSQPDDLRRFVNDAAGPCVLKPLVGTRGSGVHLVAAGGAPPSGTPLQDVLDELLPKGPVLAQLAVPGAEEGDTRIVLVGGEPLCIDGRFAAVRRVPAAGEFRSNIHLGGHPELAEWDDRLARVSRIAGPWLREAGLWMVGLDVIGDRVIEINVFSPGGLFDACRTQEVDYPAAVIELLEVAL